MAEFQIVKFDDAQNQVFGFASIAVSIDGEPTIDLQDDQIDPETLEKAAYEHVIDFRESGVMHQGAAKGRMIESIVFTPEKCRGIEKALGLPAGSIDIPTRWWVGYQYDPHTFARVKSGELKMWSIQGQAQREHVR